VLAGWAWADVVAIAVKQATAKGKLAVLLSIITISSEGRISLIPGLCGRVLVG
jgi:hypothetical protein